MKRRKNNDSQRQRDCPGECSRRRSLTRCQCLPDWLRCLCFLCWLCVLCCQCFLPCMTNGTARAEGTAQAGGTATALAINDVSGLLAMASNPGGSFVLNADLDLSGTDWIPFPFYGTLEGNGYGIYNLTVRRPAEQLSSARDGNLKEYQIATAGLFSELRGAEIRNLRIVGADIQLESESHCFAAILAGKVDHSGVINVSVHGRVSLISHGVMAGTGGIAGYGNADFEKCTARVEMIFEDRQRQEKCEQFMGGILACGIGSVVECAADVDGYDSCHGYVHNGGLVGMYYHCGQDVKGGKVTGNAVTGRISFFEDNKDRRAYCAGVIGEKLTKPSRLRNNTDSFIRDETRKTDRVLLPERCETPRVTETVIAPENGHWGYTMHRCEECGYAWTDQYTAP